MLSFRKRLIFLIALLCLCTGPLHTEAAFRVESALLYNARPDGAARDNPASGPFSIYDPGVWYRIDWRNYRAGVEYRYEWIAPNGEIAHVYRNTRDSDSNGGSYARISSQRLYDHGPGAWKVRFYYDGALKQESGFEFKDPGDFTHLLYAPDFGNLEAGVIVAVHSSDYNPITYFHMFREYAERKHMVLVAPYFPKETFHYQTIFRGTPRADLHLKSILKEVYLKTGANTDRLYLYGKSAGAQFVHRYLLAYPETVARAVIAAPGYWTFPDEDSTFPYGLGHDRRVPEDVRFDIDRALQVPVMVVMGDGDVERTENLNQSERADAQGRNRLERSLVWMNAMGRQAVLRGVPYRYHYHLEVGADHGDLRGKTEERTMDFLFDINDNITVTPWNMSALFEPDEPRGARARAIVIQVGGQTKPVALHAGPSPTDLRRYAHLSWRSIIFGYEAPLPFAVPNAGTILYAQLEFADGSRSHLSGVRLIDR
ncbi:MAG: hypothetical protein KDK27_05340 [Leptospiraceae bacterium]|nr:hypothetical protein [Leptospiraceae bacterium]